MSEVIQMFDQGRSVKRSISDVTFESFPGKNVSFNSISCLSINILILFLTKHYVTMPMMTSQILKSADFTKTQKSRYLENVTIFFLQIKRANLWQKIVCSRGNLLNSKVLQYIFYKKPSKWSSFQIFLKF